MNKSSAGAEASAPVIEAAAAQILPLFPEGIGRATPMSGAPHILGWADFESRYRTTPARQARMSTLHRALSKMRSAGVPPQFVLVGGSHLDLRNTRPNDLDCAIFYAAGVSGKGPVEFLTCLSGELKREQVDARFMPADVSPVVVAKLVGFFTLLYAQRKGEETKSIVLVDVLPAT